MALSLPRTVVVGFIAGALGVLLFHQIVVLIFYVLGLIPIAPYSLAPTAPLGVPEFLSATFWGGIWGIVLVLLMRWVRATDRLWVAVLFGAILLPLVYILVVAPLKGQAGPPPSALFIVFGLVVNGAWGLGTFLFYRLLRRRLG
ncbi:MAG: hypothetical protein ACM3N5_04090 [Candidatus Eiseniibacteriota bacterium]